MKQHRFVHNALPLIAIMLVLVTFLQRPASSTNAAPGKLVVAYAAAWSLPNRASAASLDGSKYSILIYAFVGINPATNSCTADWTDPESNTFIGASQMADIVAGLKDNKVENGGLKVLLSIGGGGYASKFEQLTDYNAFASSCYNLMTSVGADGLDVDYEFPETWANSTRMTQIMAAMHARLGNNGAGTGTYLLTMGAAASSYYGQWQDAASLQGSVDYFTTMAYNFHGAWETTLNYNSPLSGCGTGSGLCAQDTAYYWHTTRGVPKSKLLIGAGFYGNQYGGASCSATPGVSGYGSITTVDYKSMRTNGMLSGSTTAGAGWTRSYNTGVNNAALCNGSTWIGYEDSVSIKARADWLRDNGYPGMMLWEVGKDYNQELIGAVCASFGCSTSAAAPTSTFTGVPAPATALPAGSYTRFKSKLNGQYLYQSGTTVRYGAVAAGDTASHWTIETFNGRKRIKNRATGQYMHIEAQHGTLESGTVPDAWMSAQWTVENAPTAGYTVIRNAWHSADIINIQGQTGNAQYGALATSSDSAQWLQEPVGGTAVPTATSIPPTATRTNTSVASTPTATRTGTTAVVTPAPPTATAPQGGVSYVRLKNLWTGTYLYQSGAVVKYGSPAVGDTTSHWVLEHDAATGSKRLKNRATGQYMHIENLNGSVQAGPIQTGWASARWFVETASTSGYVLIRNAWQSSSYIHVENQTGNAQYGTICACWGSAQWLLENV